MRTIWTSQCLLALVIFVLPIRADSPAPAKAFTVYSHDRAIRVDSIPKDIFGSNGKTEVFDLAPSGQTQLFSFNWYAHDLLVQRTPSGVALIRFGGWPGGRKASDKALAFSFYLGNKLLKTYSSLDIAESPDNVVSSVSHHVYSHGPGKIIHNSEQKRFEFSIERVDGIVLTFNIENGELLSRKEKFAEIRESDWFKENLNWTKQLKPKLLGPRSGSPSDRIISQRGIWAGTVSLCSNTTTNWSIQLGAPVQLEPGGTPGHLIQAHCTNSLPCPGEGEVWALSGTLNGPFLIVRTAKRFPQFEAK